MDNIKLNDLLKPDKDRQFWIKPVGDPANPPSPGLIYNQAIERVEFAKKPSGVNLDDILFVYAVGQSKLLYIVDYFTPLHEATPDDIAREPWRSRWSWSFRGHNYTPTYGSQWWKFHIKPFDLLKEYNLLQPDDKQKLGAILYGQDKQRISQGFALFIINKIINL